MKMHVETILWMPDHIELESIEAVDELARKVQGRCYMDQSISMRSKMGS